MCNIFPDDVFYLDREQLRLLSDPLRQRIVKLLAQKEMSTTELSETLPDAPSNLYYHVDRLRDAGLITLIRSEPRRGTIEKYYAAVAKCFMVKPELVATMGEDSSADEELLGGVRGVVEDTFQGFARTVVSGALRDLDAGDSAEALEAIVVGISIRAKQERIAELHRRLAEWLKDVSEEEGDEAGNEYQGLVMFFPTKAAPYSGEA
jgi:DNA-binding transcriptional ArsR family regulator